MSVLPIFSAGIERKFLRYTSKLTPSQAHQLRLLCISGGGLDPLRSRLVLNVAFRLYTGKRSFEETLQGVLRIRKLKQTLEA